MIVKKRSNMAEKRVVYQISISRYYELIDLLTSQLTKKWIQKLLMHFDRWVKLNNLSEQMFSFFKCICILDDFLLRIEDYEDEIKQTYNEICQYTSSTTTTEWDWAIEYFEWLYLEPESFEDE